MSRVFAAVLLVLAAFGSRDAGAVSLRTGDILVADAGFTAQAVFHIDPQTGDQTVVFSVPGPSGVVMFGLAFAPGGALYGAGFDLGAVPATNQGIVSRIDPVAGSKTDLVTGLPFTSDLHLAVAPSGQIFVTDLGAGTLGLIVRIDPVTHATFTVPIAGILEHPSGLAFAPNGQAFVTARTPAPASIPAVFRLDPVAGTLDPTPVSSGTHLVGPRAIAVAANGQLYVADLAPALSPLSSVIRIDPVTGAQTVLTATIPLETMHGITVTPTQELLVSGGGFEDGDTGAVIRIDPTTAAQTVVSSGGQLREPFDIALVPPFRGFVAGAGPKGEPRVVVVDAAGTTRISFLAYDAGFTGGVRVAAGDVDGDGVPDVITAPADGRRPVKVFDGAALLGGQVVEKLSFDPYDDSIKQGIDVSAADLNGDGLAEIITGPGAGPKPPQGPGPEVRVFNGLTGAQLPSPLGGIVVFDPDFKGGVSVSGMR